MSAKSLADLAGGGAFHRTAEQPLEVQSTLESLGQAIADMRRVRLEIPWSWRIFGGTHRLRLNLTAEGKARAIEAGAITLPAATGWLLGFAAVLAGLLGLLAGVLFLRGRRPRAEPSVFAALHDLIGRGLPARRAVVELTRGFPESLAGLATADPALLSDPRYPLLQTQAGRRRFEEIVALLRQSDDSLLGDDLAVALAEAIAAKTPARPAALSITARVPEDQRSDFCGLGWTSWLPGCAKRANVYPILASPRSRGAALAIQDALRAQAGAGLAVAWLVRAAGPGRRGETLRVAAGRAVLGRGPSCAIRLEADKQVAEQHAALSETRGEFAIEPLQGGVKIEDKPALSVSHLAMEIPSRLGRAALYSSVWPRETCARKAARDGTQALPRGGLNEGRLAWRRPVFAAASRLEEPRRCRRNSPPPAQFRPALQVPPAQHGCPLSPQASHAPACSSICATADQLAAVQNLWPPADRTAWIAGSTAGTGVTDAGPRLASPVVAGADGVCRYASAVGAATIAGAGIVCTATIAYDSTGLANERWSASIGTRALTADRTGGSAGAGFANRRSRNRVGQPRRKRCKLPSAPEFPATSRAIGGAASAFAQQGWSAPPQAVQVAAGPLPLQAVPAAVQVPFAQQGWSAPPQAVQVAVVPFRCKLCQRRCRRGLRRSRSRVGRRHRTRRKLPLPPRLRCRPCQRPCRCGWCRSRSKARRRHHSECSSRLHRWRRKLTLPAVQMPPLQQGSPKAPQVPASDTQTPCSQRRPLAQRSKHCRTRRNAVVLPQQPPWSQTEPAQQAWPAAPQAVGCESSLTGASTTGHPHRFSPKHPWPWRQ